MSAERMFDLTIRPLVDGGFELEQLAGGLEDPDLVRLHPVQARLLAECAGLLPQPDATLLDRLSARHVRRIQALADRVRELRYTYTDTIIDRCAEGIEICLYLEAIEDMALDLVEDCDRGTAPPAAPVTEKIEANGTDAAISVTPKSKRGRPAKPDALTNSERQARHRAKQGELLPVTNASTEAVESNAAPRSSDRTEGAGEHHRASDLQEGR